MPELLAPAGNWDCVRAAIANGANAIYFGLPQFNARMRADNFTEEDLPKVVEFCHQHGVKAYVAFNTLVFTSELKKAQAQLLLLNQSGVDAVIIQDIGLAWLAKTDVPDLPVHASTQMTLTSPEGVCFAKELGVKRAVLARELSLRDLAKFGLEIQSSPTPQPLMPLEVFVHGALCVAYSGQCLTSESLGQRSANRGECAQACRMPYELIVDGTLRDLGDRRYLLSPQDLAATEEIPALLELGITSFKIEGRLKSPEYVAAVTQVYRKAIDCFSQTSTDRYQLEMTFSRGLFSGWLNGANHQKLVAARFGKKRGPFVGRILRVGENFVELESSVHLKPGDGVVFDKGENLDHEQGGRIWQMTGSRLFFGQGHIQFTRLKPGDRVWKTDDPELNHRLRKSYAGHLPVHHKKIVIHLQVTGKAGGSMILETSGVRVQSSMPLQAARTAPLTIEKLRAHLGRFTETIYELGDFINHLEGDVILPIGEMNRMRRELVSQLTEKQPPRLSVNPISLDNLLLKGNNSELYPQINADFKSSNGLSVLCRDLEQIEIALDSDVKQLYADFEDLRLYKKAVDLVRHRDGSEIYLATPRIQKPGEQGFFKLIENAAPDGVLIRNLGAIDYFKKKSLKKIGDFSLNIANPLTALYLLKNGLNRLTVSYDLNIEQVIDLLKASPAGCFELTLHQHMPMFHMDHCVYAAFLSNGTDHTNCGRPCDHHRVHLRDRVGIEHPLRADVGCRNTLFNAVPQTGARFFETLTAAGLRQFRIELLEESPDEIRSIIRAYQSLLEGKANGETLWRRLKAQSQLGVTHGTYRTLEH